MEKLTKISVLGCGWLGLPLAKSLALKGFEVKGSTTQEAKLADIEKAGVAPYLIHLDPEFSGDPAFLDSDILFLNIPPRNRNDDPDYHLRQLRSLKIAADQSPLSWVIMASSTGIYENLGQVVTEENASPDAVSRGGVNLMEAEKIWQNQASFQTTTLRFGGLYGPGREPGRFFQGRKGIPGGKNPINMIHLDDCIGLIQNLIASKPVYDVFNACSPSHPTREAFYTLQAKQLGVAAPEFLDNYTSWKEVSPEKLIKATGYQFQY